MFMTIQDTKETGSLDNDKDVKLSKRLSNLSPCSLSAAVSSAFNILKHKQNLVKNGSRNSDVSSNSSVNSTASSSNGYCKLIKGNKRATDSDDELYQSTNTNNNNNNNHNNNYESYDDSQNEIIDNKSNNDKISQFYQNQLPLLNCIKYFESPINQSQIQYDCTAPIARNTPENNELILADYRHSKIASFNVDGKNLICLPQAFEMFLKNLVGGLHTVYTKLKRLDIVPIVCNVEQVRVLRAHGAIQPGVNRCKLIAPSEFDTLYEDCTNSGSRPGRPPKRHTANDSNENNTTINNNNNNNNTFNHDDSPNQASSITRHKIETKTGNNSMNNSLNVRLENQTMPLYYVSPSLNNNNNNSSQSKNELNEKQRTLPVLNTSPRFNEKFSKNLEPDIINNTNSFATAFNNFNYMHKFGFMPYSTSMKQHNHDTNFHPYLSDTNGSFNSAAALAALKLFQPQFANFQQNMQEQNHMKNYFNEYLIQNNHQQAELMQKSCIREQEQDRLSIEQQQQQQQQKINTKTYSDSNKGMFKNNEVEVNSDFEEDEDEDDDDKFRKKTNNNNLHPLSVEYLTGSGRGGTNTSSSSTSSSRNDSLDVMTNATGSSYSSLSNNNYGQNGGMLSSRSSPFLVKETSKENNWPPSSSSSIDLIHNNTMIYICSLINIVKNSVSKLDVSFKNDIENLRKSLAAEKLLRRRCDSKIHHLIRLQNNLQNKLKTYNLTKLKRKRFQVKRLNTIKSENQLE